MKITLRNDFHATAVNLYVDGDALSQGGASLTPSQIARTRRELCEMADCHCGDALSCRGPQEVNYETGQDSGARTTATLWSKP